MGERWAKLNEAEKAKWYDMARKEKMKMLLEEQGMYRSQPNTANIEPPNKIKIDSPAKPAEAEKLNSEVFKLIPDNEPTAVFFWELIMQKID